MGLGTKKEKTKKQKDTNTSNFLMFSLLPNSVRRTCVCWRTKREKSEMNDKSVYCSSRSCSARIFVRVDLLTISCFMPPLELHVNCKNLSFRILEAQRGFKSSLLCSGIIFNRGVIHKNRITLSMEFQNLFKHFNII